MAQIFIKYVYIYIWLLTQKLLSFCLFWAFTHYFLELAPNFLSGHVRTWLIRDHILSLCVYFPQITDMNSIHSLNLCFFLETYSTFLFPYVFFMLCSSPKICSLNCYLSQYYILWGSSLIKSVTNSSFPFDLYCSVPSSVTMVQSHILPALWKHQWFLLSLWFLSTSYPKSLQYY